MVEEWPLDEEEEWLETQRGPIGTAQVLIYRSYFTEELSFSIEKRHHLVFSLCIDASCQNGFYTDSD